MNFKKYRSIFVILGIIIYLTFKGSYIPHLCLFENFLELKCPFCGITKSFEEIIKFNFLNAFKINFMSYFLIMYLVINSILNHYSLLKESIKMDKLFIGLCFVQFFVLNFQVFNV